MVEEQIGVLTIVANPLANMSLSSRVQAQALAGWVQLGVEDNGPGVAPAVAARLFDPFVSTRPEGTGLGLAIARTLAEHLGGELALDPGPGVGARFVLRLPQVN